MLNRILFPLDGSFLTMMALDVATRVLDPHCEVVLLRAIPVPESNGYGPGPDTSTALELTRKEALHYLNAVAETLRKQGFQPQIRVQTGDPVEVIVRVADEDGVDMIMMSTHGRAGIRPGLCSQITKQVLKSASCPVVVISNGQGELLDYESDQEGR